MNTNGKKPMLPLTNEQLDVIAASLMEGVPRYKDSWGDRWGVNGPKPLDIGSGCRHGSSHNDEFMDRAKRLVDGGYGTDAVSISNRSNGWVRFSDDGRSGFDIP